MEIIVKDFMGNELKEGDKVVISDRTYSKTDYLKYGIITKIDEPHLFKNGNLDYIDIHIERLGRSDAYREDLEARNYVHTPPTSNWDNCRFRYSNKCYINILKVS